nr:hypothetical protein [Desulfobacterales bacterium]
MTRFQADRSALLIGSLPLTDHLEATKLVLEYTPEIPIWVQLPIYRKEGLLRQFLSGVPGLTETDQQVFIDTSLASFEEDVLRFYEDYLGVVEEGAPIDSSRFVLDHDVAKGFFSLLDVLGTLPAPPRAVKGQISGPFTLSTGLTDQNRRALFYDDRLRDIIVKTIALKGRWQAEQMARLGTTVIVFIDEPGLAGFGSSSYIGISRNDVMGLLEEVIASIHDAGALVGVHVCANTDWSLILDSSADILSFDAYGFFDRLILYPEQLTSFFESGRILAWGIVPTTNPDDILRESASLLVSKWQEQIAQLEGIGIDNRRLMSQSLITPSCGVGSLTRELALKVLEMTRDVSQLLRKNNR